MKLTTKKISFIIFIFLCLLLFSIRFYFEKNIPEYVLTKDFIVMNNDLGSAFGIYPERVYDENQEYAVEVRTAEGVNYTIQHNYNNDYYYTLDNNDFFLLKKGTVFTLGKKILAGGGCSNPEYFRMDVLSCSDKEFEREFIMNAKIYSPSDKNGTMFILTLHQKFFNSLKIKTY